VRDLLGEPDGSFSFAPSLWDPSAAPAVMVFPVTLFKT
jgi:hypothetical protein